MATSQNFSDYAGDSEALAMTLTGYDNISAINLTAASQIDAYFKRVLADPDSVARIAKTLLITTITITGAPTGGAWTATIGGQTTADIAYNASASAVKSAVEALASVGAGHSIVLGGPGPSTAWTICLVGTAVGQTISVAESIGTPFTGGATPAVADTVAGGGVTITDPVNGKISVTLDPADTVGVQATLQLQYAVKVFPAAITGGIGLLTIVPTVVQAT